MAASRLRRTFARSFALVAMVVVAGCGSDPTGVSIIDTRFAESLGVDLDASIRTGTGLYYRDITVGTGTQAAVGSRVTVRYELFATNGQRREGNTLQPFTIGSGVMMAGFDEGIRGMRVGGTRQLIVPPHLGDGTIMVFTVELLSMT